MLTPCAKHVVAKAASKVVTASVNFIVAIRESLSTVAALYTYKPENNIAIDSGVVAFLSMYCQRPGLLLVFRPCPTR